MPNMNRRVRPRLRFAFSLCLLGLLLILPTIVSGNGSTIWVAPPNGKDDTANIQAALNASLASFCMETPISAAKP